MILTTRNTNRPTEVIKLSAQYAEGSWAVVNSGNNVLVSLSSLDEEEERKAKTKAKYVHLNDKNLELKRGLNFIISQTALLSL